MKTTTCVIFGLFLFFISCSKKMPEQPYPCLDGSCETRFYLDTINGCQARLDGNGYWHVNSAGSRYFTVRGELAKLNPEYVVNKVPLVAVTFDSDYWLAFDSIQFTTPIYSPIGTYTGPQLNTPIAVGNQTYTIATMRKNTDVTNLAGYTIDSHMCLDCPYSPTLFCTYSRYTYEPQKSMFLLAQMVGDTAQVFVDAFYNTDGASREERITVLKVVFD